MMNPADSFSPMTLGQDCALYDPNQNDFAVVEALLGPSCIDPMEFFPAFNIPGLPDLFDNYQIQAGIPESPGFISSPSFPPSPFSSSDELSDLGAADTQAPYNPNLSPSGLSVLTPLVDQEEVKPAKADLEGFEYNPLIRKWVCAKCNEKFVSTHEARRHVKTAAKCTGKKVKCLRCGDDIHAAQWSRKRHFGSKKCQKKGRKTRGTPSYTVHNAFKEL